MMPAQSRMARPAAWSFFHSGIIWGVWGGAGQVVGGGVEAQWGAEG